MPTLQFSQSPFTTAYNANIQLSDLSDLSFRKKTKTQD